MERSVRECNRINPAAALLALSIIFLPYGCQKPQAGPPPIPEVAVITVETQRVTKSAV